MQSSLSAFSMSVCLLSAIVYLKKNNTSKLYQIFFACYTCSLGSVVKTDDSAVYVMYFRLCE